MSNKKILLIHTSNVLLHYRVAIYNYFSRRFKQEGFDFHVITDKFQDDNPHPVNFNLHITESNFLSILKKYKELSPQILISFNSLSDFSVFPTLAYHKFLNKKLIFWGHGINLEKPKRNRFLYDLWHKFSDAIILYSPNEIKYISEGNRNKVFVAINTLDLSIVDTNYDKKIFKKYNIKTSFNVIFVGRIEKNKKLDDLIKAFNLINNSEIGLIIVGDDKHNLIPKKLPNNIYYLGPVYKNELHSLLEHSNIFCIPGHVGLGIVDAFFHSLPIITQDVIHAPEICYLKDGINGFLLKEASKEELSKTIINLFEDPQKVNKMGKAAKQTIMNEGSIEKMFYGFLEACKYLDNE